MPAPSRDKARRWPSRTPGYVAYHEAGHAIVALALGSPVIFATIVPDEAKGYGGAVHRGYASHPDGSLAHHRRDVVIKFAGSAAQRRSHPRSDVHHSAELDREAWEIRAEVLFDCLTKRRGFLQDAAAEARRLVDQHWFAIDRVARELTAHRSVSGFAIERISAEAEDEWRQVASYHPGLTPFAYARECAVAAQGLPPLRRSHVAAAALRATMAGTSDVAAAVLADLTGLGYEAAAVTLEWNRAKEALAS